MLLAPVCMLPLQMHTHGADEEELASASTSVQHRQAALCYWSVQPGLGGQRWSG